MTAAAYQDPIIAAADPAALERWLTAQKRTRYDLSASRKASGPDLRRADLPSTMRGLYRHGDHAITVPMRDMQGEVWAALSLPHQYHPDAPTDFYRPGWTLWGRVLGLHYWHGPQIEGDGTGKVIGIVEHLHDAPTWASETRTPCAVAFHPDNFVALVNALRAVYPQAVLIFWAWRKKQEAAMHAAAQTTTAHVAVGSEGVEAIPEIRARHTAGSA